MWGRRSPCVVEKHRVDFVDEEVRVALCVPGDAAHRSVLRPGLTSRC